MKCAKNMWIVIKEYSKSFFIIWQKKKSRKRERKSIVNVIFPWPRTILGRCSARLRFSMGSLLQVTGIGKWSGANILDLMEQCQGMSREADMIETYVRGLEAGRQSALAVAGGRCVKWLFWWKGETDHVNFRPDLPMGGGGGYGSTPSCYRCNGYFSTFSWKAEKWFRCQIC